MSVKVINTGPKIIGLGGLPIQPNEAATLPKGFGLDHPTVDFFVRRGWLTEAASEGILIPPARQEADIPGTPEDDGDVEENQSTPAPIITAPGDGGEDNPGSPPPELSRRDVERMNLEGLRELAQRRGIEFAQGANRQTLIGLITAGMAETTRQSEGQE